MKREYFAIGSDQDVAIICEYRQPGRNEPPKKGVIYGRVLNGAWDFTIENGIMTVIAKGTRHEVKIIWKGRLPDGFGHYMDIIEYIEKRLSRWPITNYAIDRVILIKDYGKRVTRAIKAAVRNFKVVYREDSTLVQDEEDLIPF